MTPYWPALLSLLKKSANLVELDTSGRSSKSKDSHKVLRPNRPAFAPLKRPSEVRTIDSHDLLSPHPKSQDIQLL